MMFHCIYTLSKSTPLDALKSKVVYFIFVVKQTLIEFWIKMQENIHKEVFIAIQWKEIGK